MNQIQQFFEYILNAVKVFVIIQPWQTGIRVRAGKKIKKLDKGIFFRIPYLDSVYVQEARLRVADLAMQTLTSKDLKTVTVNCAFGYSINNIEKLYNTLYHPESTLKNIVSSEIASFIYSKTLTEIKPKDMETHILKKLKENDYGLNFEYFRLINFAVVRTYRLIQDQSWIHEGLEMDKKK